MLKISVIKRYMKWCNKMIKEKEVAAVVFDIQKFSIHDGPGIRTNIFLKGCGLKCKWCSNPESINPWSEIMVYPAKCLLCGRCVDVCEEHALSIDQSGFKFDRRVCTGCGACADVCYAGARKLSGRSMSVEEVFTEIMKDESFYRKSNGGVTFTGGEALLHPKFVKEVAKKCKNEKISVAVETAGHVKWQNIEDVIDYIDYFLYDIKLADTDKFSCYCNGDLSLVKNNLLKLDECNLDGQKFELIIRIPVIPEVNTSEEEMDKIVGLINQLKTVNKVHLLPYHDLGYSKYVSLETEYAMKEKKPPEDDVVQRFSYKLKGYEVTIGG